MRSVCVRTNRLPLKHIKNNRISQKMLSTINDDNGIETATKTPQKIRRRKRRFVHSKYDDPGENVSDTRSATASKGTTGVFSPKKEDGTDFDSFDDYIASVPLSPWVPTPDPVARRMLQLAGADVDDVHYDLGSGDGRLNFMALDVFKVKKSVGLELDKELLKMCEDRLSKRWPRPDNLHFIRTDILDVDKLSENVNLSECTVLTMFFVEDALQKIKPLLEEKFAGTGCRIVANGYAVKGWKPKWKEFVLGLPIFLYEIPEGCDWTKCTDDPQVIG